MLQKEVSSLMQDSVFKKKESNKPEMWLLPFEALEQISDLMTWANNNKYTKHSWRTLPNGEEQYLNAMLRHMSAMQQGEEVCSDMPFPHAVAIATDALFFLSHYLARKTNLDKHPNN